MGIHEKLLLRLTDLYNRKGKLLHFKTFQQACLIFATKLPLQLISIIKFFIQIFFREKEVLILLD